MDKTVYTELSMRLLTTLENHTTMRWFSGMSPTKFFPKLKNRGLLIFAWDTGELTWTWLRYFDKDDRYLKVKQDEFIRWCVERFPKGDD